MSAVDLTPVLAEACSEVLETMYFTGVMSNEFASAPINGEWICMRLEFRGFRTGCLGVRTPLRTARILAESFLGAEPETISETNCEEVLGEMTNMICGAALKRLAHEQRSDMSHPETESPSWSDSWLHHTVARMFELEEGALGIWLDWEVN
jgi:CheY-specific phosphatase CheX